MNFRSSARYQPLCGSPGHRLRARADSSCSLHASRWPFPTPYSPAGPTSEVSSSLTHRKTGQACDPLGSGPHYAPFSSSISLTRYPLSTAQSNFFEWEALIQGPEETPFEGGVFLAKLSFVRSSSNLRRILRGWAAAC